MRSFATSFAYQGAWLQDQARFRCSGRPSSTHGCTLCRLPLVQKLDSVCGEQQEQNIEANRRFTRGGGPSFVCTQSRPSGHSWGVNWCLIPFSYLNVFCHQLSEDLMNRGVEELPWRRFLSYLVARDCSLYFFLLVASRKGLLPLPLK